MVAAFPCITNLHQHLEGGEEEIGLKEACHCRKVVAILTEKDGCYVPRHQLCGETRGFN